MPDDRSTGLGRSYISFNSMDSNVAGVPNRKNSREQNSSSQDDKDKEENNKEPEFMDRSAQLRASLNSLAMLNVTLVKKNDSKDLTDKNNKPAKNIFKE